MDKKTKRIANVVVAAALLMLFILPRSYLDGVCGQILQTSREARQAVLENGDPGPVLTGMEGIYERHAPKLRLFLDHGSVDELGMAIVACTPLSDREALFSALNEVEAAVEHLKSIETLSTDSLF